MKVLFTFSILLMTTMIYSQYNYGLDVCGQDAKIEGKLNLDSGNNSVFVGNNAGINNTSGFDNSFFGPSAGSKNTTRAGNSFFGRSSGLSNTSRGGDSFVGRAAGLRNTTGSSNSIFGQNSGDKNTSGNNNTFIGQSSGRSNTTGSNNCFFGFRAGYSIKTGTNNISIGTGSGPTALNYNLSNRLYIGVNNSYPGGNDNPLIYGEFDNDLIRINGALEVTETLHISETAKLEPQMTVPTCGTNDLGLMYVNAIDSTLYCVKVLWAGKKSWCRHNLIYSS